MTADKSEERRIFNRAAEIEDPAKRLEFLEAACGGDLELRAEIYELLRHDAEAGSFLDVPAELSLSANVQDSSAEQRRDPPHGGPNPTTGPPPGRTSPERLGLRARDDA